MADDKAGSTVDDWLDDLDEPAPENPEPGGAASSAGGAETVSPAAINGELDQADIDSLFSGGAPTPAPEQGEDFGDLDQSDIDALLSGGKETVAAAPSSGPELDQADIDSLFTSGDPGKASVSPSLEPSLDSDLDELFTALDSQVAENSAAGLSAKDSPGEANAGGFDDDEFDFGDLPDIPGDDDLPLGNTSQTENRDVNAAHLPDNVADFFGENPEKNKERPAVAKEEMGAAKRKLPSPAGSKKKMLAIAAALALLLSGAGGGYWYLNRGQQPPPPVAEEKRAELVVPPMPEPVLPLPTPNIPPLASESRWRMTGPNETIEIELKGSDENNDPLSFEIVVPPKFGRLSGEPPKVSYLPNKDFPGEDSFEFRVSDGKQASEPVKVGILGPDGSKATATAGGGAVSPQKDSDQAANASARPAKKRPPVLLARNLRLQTLSTEALIIDWPKIWKAANRRPFGPQVEVEILSVQPGLGQLRQLDRERHVYEPDRYGGGQETLRYRFRASGLVSREGELAISVKANDRAPVLALAPVRDTYRVGEKVLLDASASQDDSPGALRYNWKQLAGTPVLLEKLGEQGAVISFVAPSSFRSQQDNRIIIQVTATDAGGQQTSREIAISPLSKRPAALWGAEEK